MLLNLPNLDSIEQPTLDQVIRAIKSLDHESESPFVMLEDEEAVDCFIQVYKVSARRFHVEYSEGDPPRLLATVDDVSQKVVIEMFLSYLDGSKSYRGMAEWVDITEELHGEDDSVNGQDRDDDRDEEGIAHELLRSEHTAPSLAEEISSLLVRWGYRADYSLESLAEIDRLIEEHSKDGEAMQGGLLSPENLPPDRRTKVRLLALGCYVGEVLRKSFGGDWENHPDHPHRPDLWSLVLPTSYTVYPVNKVFKRFLHGPEHSVMGFGIVLGKLASPR